MRLYVYKGQFINSLNGDYIGKCINDYERKYWYFDINHRFIKKNTFKNWYWL